MTDEPNQKVFSATNPPQINEKYERLPEVENQIREVLQLSAADFSVRMAISDRESELFLRAETLACLLSVAHAENSVRIENLIADKLLLICEKRIGKILLNKSFEPNFVEEMVRDIYAEMVAQIIKRTEKSYDFWEVRFYKSLTIMIYAYLRTHAAKYRATSLFTELSNEEDDEANFENRLDSGRDLAREIEIKETSKKILAKMPEDLRKIFIFYYRDEETQKTIAERLNITDRTVRNKLSEIREFLDNYHKSQGEN